ncbi:MAG: alginate lyase family protein [Alphaproteobacteria bacterium]|nr:alginate lyase family protein [Alphaproteobacteria bacterium]
MGRGEAARSLIAALALWLAGAALAGAFAGDPVPADDKVIGAAVVSDPNASFVDLAARRAELVRVTSPRVIAALRALKPCESLPYPEPPLGQMVIPPYYLSGRHGPVNPAHAVAERPYVRFETAVAMAATAYAATGDAGQAECLVSILDHWARVSALLDYDRSQSPQAWYTVEWTAAAAALALSVVRGAPGLDRKRLDNVTTWLVPVAQWQLAQVDRDRDGTSARNNHAHWRGLMATAVGVVAANDALFRRGLAAFRDAVASLDAAGAWPLEMARKERALHYQSFALQPLVLIAELAWRQGIDLYALSANGRTIHDAARFLLRALADTGVVAHYTPEPQYSESLKPGSGEFAWAEFYARRFPGESLAPWLGAPLFNRRLGGGATVYVAPTR